MSSPAASSPAGVRLASAAAFLAAAACGLVAAAEPAFEKRTFTYKTAGEVKIEADVHRASDDRPRPVLVWIHGGALINGSRSGVPGELLELARSAGYCLVSIDYRLAPEVKLPAIIEDLRDALRWIREEGPKRFHAEPAKLVVAGGSAGGYLALMTGVIAEPRPQGIVAYWGYGDVDGDWYTKPSEHYLKSRRVSEETARKAIGAKVLTGVEDKEVSAGRGSYYLYLRQNGLWTREVTGFDPATERSKLDPFCPVRNVTAVYPPTVLVHGTADTDVPHALSVDMATALEKRGVTHELLSVPGAGHGLGGGAPGEADKASARALAFIRKRLE